MRELALWFLVWLLAVGPAVPGALAAAEPEPVALRGRLLAPPAPRPWPAAPRPDGRLVVVYASHPRETYADGTPVAWAADALAADLAAEGFRRVIRPHVPAAGPGLLAYLRSRAAVAPYAWRASLWLIDVHRDDTAPGSYRFMLAGRPVARVMIVLGARNPLGWRNRRRAERVAAAAQALAPGWLIGLWLGPGDYNQDLTPGAILVEIGNADSDAGEVAGAADLLARALAAAGR